MPRRQLVLLLAFAALALRASALPNDDRLLLTPFGGVMFWSENSDLEASWEGGLALGLMFNQWVGMELNVGLDPARTREGSVSGSGDIFATRFSLDLMYRPLSNRRLQPYVFVGGGNVRYTTDDIAAIDEDYASISVGGGLLYTLRETTESRISLRVDLRDQMTQFNSPLPNDAGSFSQNFGIGAGVTFEFGTDSHRDSDADGVIDKQDDCPETEIGVIVDARGCPIDSDGDGIFDGPDQCANTPEGAIVDENGCPLDGDGDGVYDGLDQCADTPLGAVVDDAGCPIDSDKDTVFDGLDKCPNTPGAVAVDENGCPRIDSEQERGFYETGKLILADVQFESGKSELLPSSRQSLNIIADVVRKWPDIVIEVGGHTDNRGNEARNTQLSQERAEAVRTYLLQRYRHIRDDQLVAKGYGPVQPVADNNTEEGRTQNRRVEFVILSGAPSYE